MIVSGERRSRLELQQAWLEAGNESPERAHGEWPVVRMYADQFVKLSQIRGGKNPVSQKLKESIAANGLLNMIDSANVSEELLAEYIDFTNRTWQAEASIDDFTHLRLEDGTYQLVVGGNSRHEAIEEGEQEGLFPPRPIAAKNHVVTTVMDIITLQQDENIHSTPTVERGALAAVEAYKWGLEQGDWSNRDELLQKYEGPKVKSKTLRDALYFHEMPRDVMLFALSGKMHFTVGVEIGKSMDTLRDFTAVKTGYSGSGDERLKPGTEDAILLEKAVYEELMGKASHLSGSRMNSTAGKKHVEAWRRDMKRFLAKERKENDGEPELELVMVTPKEQLETHLRMIERENEKRLNELAKKPAADYAEIIRLNERLIGREKAEELRCRMEAALKGELSTLGRSALNADATADDQEAMF